jgi:putative phosphoesterase
MKIGLLSDTHGHVDSGILSALEYVDEIWHAGDFGNHHVVDTLQKIAPLKGVYGNIDDTNIRAEFPEYLTLELENFKCLMIHIGGKPGKYSVIAKKLIQEYRPQIFICGHSHILKIIKDHANHCWYFNPGAAGHHGFHIQRTLIRFELNDSKISNLEVVELGKRGKIFQ